MKFVSPIVLLAAAWILAACGGPSGPKGKPPSGPPPEYEPPRSFELPKPPGQADPAEPASPAAAPSSEQPAAADKKPASPSP